jgi:hypothetical protein
MKLLKKTGRRSGKSSERHINKHGPEIAGTLPRAASPGLLLSWLPIRKEVS